MHEQRKKIVLIDKQQIQSWDESSFDVSHKTLDHPHGFWFNKKQNVKKKGSPIQILLAISGVKRTHVLCSIITITVVQSASGGLAC